jgi:YD repeat-containing protein
VVTTTNEISQTQSTKVYVIYRFDAQGRVASLTDSSEGVAAISKYAYDANNNLISITNTAKNPMTGEETIELHKWLYNSNNKPYRLFRVLNGKDTTDYGFKTDASGNVIEEQGFRASFPIGDPTLYYYDDLNRLTDIVKFNPHANRLLPDFMFEYNAANQVLQKTSTISTIREPAPLPRGQMPKPEEYKGKGATLRLTYLAWRYTYDEKGLKIRETLYGKDKTKIGHIEYDYSFGQ